jgi:serine/threonine protein kinase
VIIPISVCFVRVFTIETLFAMGGLISCCIPSGRIFELNGRRLRSLECIGEGGFSYVYRVRLTLDVILASHAGQVQDLGDGRTYALKKMYVQTKEQLQDAQWEIEVHHSINDEHCLHLIDHGIFNVPNSVTTKEVVMLTPYYKV